MLARTKKTPNLICVVCDGPIGEGKRAHTKYCSPHCTNIRRSPVTMRARSNRRCLQCDTPLPKTMQHQARYCGESCRSTATRLRLAEKHLSVRRNMRAAQPLRMLVYRAKWRAKQLGIEFDITAEALTVPKVCPILGIELQWNLGVGRKGFHPNSPSLDRIEPAGGYIQSNVRVISARANLLKSDATVQELELVLADLKQLREPP